MKIYLISDLHLDHWRCLGDSFWSEVPYRPDADIICIAGDIGTFGFVDQLMSYVGEIRDNFDPAIPIYCVPGNHDFYGLSPEEFENIIYDARVARELKHYNFHFLHNQAQYLGTKKLIGGTMWFPYETGNEQYYRYMCDFDGCIKNFVPWVYDENKRFMRMLQVHCTPGDIILTHHLPHAASVAPRFAKSNLNRFFLSIEGYDIIKDCRPVLWMHGHTHEQVDAVVEGTRIVCSPVGYPTEMWTVKPLGTIIEV